MKFMHEKWISEFCVGQREDMGMVGMSRERRGEWWYALSCGIIGERDNWGLLEK